MNIRLGGEPVDWNSEAAERLANALILTENEQKFALVRAVLQLKNWDHMHGALIPSISVVGVYAAAQYVNQRYNLLAKSPFVGVSTFIALDANQICAKICLLLLSDAS